MEILCLINVFGVQEDGDIINRQLLHELLDPCLDKQASMARVFNAVPDLQPIDIYSDEKPRMTNIEYKEITNYMPTRPGPRIVRVYTSKEHKLLLETETSVTPGQIMTYTVCGSLNNLQLLPIVDDINVDIMPDRTKLRFFNLDSYSAAITITSPIGSTSLFLDFGNGSNYTEINPGEYKLQVRSTNTVNMSLTLKPGRIYTVYILGSISADSPNYIQANIPQVILSVDGNTLFDKCIWY